MTTFSTLTTLPADPIYGMQVVFKSDKRPNRINLSIGVCQEPNGKIVKFQAVSKAEEKLYSQHPSKEYLPIIGYAPFITKAIEVVCGNSEKPLLGMQTVGGTGALYIASKLLLQANVKEIFIPGPSWPNHRQLFESAGLKVTSYAYYDQVQAKLDFPALIEAISQMPEGSAILLQASCHNPTGVDPSMAEWAILSDLILKKRLVPLFDLAYQGLGTSLEGDSESIRLFLEAGHEMMVATTFAKNLGLYNERVGALIIHSSQKTLASIESHAKSIARTCYSSPPAHGAQVAALLFQDEELTAMWKSELETIRNQLSKQRQILFEALTQKNPPFAFEHLMTTSGLFCLFDLTEKEVIQLREKNALYVALDGRVCLAAITEEKAEIAANAFYELRR